MFVVWPGEVEEQEGDDGGEEEGGQVALRVPAALTVSPLPHLTANNRSGHTIREGFKKEKKNSTLQPWFGKFHILIYSWTYFQIVHRQKNLKCSN